MTTLGNHNVKELGGGSEANFQKSNVEKDNESKSSANKENHTKAPPTHPSTHPSGGKVGIRSLPPSDTPPKPPNILSSTDKPMFVSSKSMVDRIPPRPNSHPPVSPIDTIAYPAAAPPPASAAPVREDGIPAILEGQSRETAADFPGKEETKVADSRKKKENEEAKLASSDPLKEEASSHFSPSGLSHLIQTESLPEGSSDDKDFPKFEGTIAAISEEISASAGIYRASASFTDKKSEPTLKKCEHFDYTFWFLIIRNWFHYIKEIDILRKSRKHFLFLRKQTFFGILFFTVS